VTTAIGVANGADEPLFLRRLPINDADDDALFRAKLDGDYDWLQRPQSVRKQWRAFVSRLRPRVRPREREST
jgi:hypothetical protein